MIEHLAQLGNWKWLVSQVYDVNPVDPNAYNASTTPHGPKIVVILGPNDDATSQEHGTNFRNAYFNLIRKIVANYEYAKKHIPIIAVGGGSIPDTLFTINYVNSINPYWWGKFFRKFKMRLKFWNKFRLKNVYLTVSMRLRSFCGVCGLSVRVWSDLALDFDYSCKCLMDDFWIIISKMSAVRVTLVPASFRKSRERLYIYKTQLKVDYAVCGCAFL